MILPGTSGIAQILDDTASFEFVLDHPSSTDQTSVSQRLTYQSSIKKIVTVTIDCRQVRSKDTIPVYHYVFENVPLNKGPSFTELNFSKANNSSNTNQSFIRAITKLGAMPPGIYLTGVSIQSKDSTVKAFKQFYQPVDSNLSYKSPLRISTNELLGGASKSINNPKNISKQIAASKDQLQKQTTRISKKLRSEKGISVHPLMIDGKTYSELYYEEWFLGRYEIVAGKGMQDKIAGEGSMLKDNAGALVHNDLGDFQSVSGELRDLFAKGKDQKEVLKGNVELSQYLGNGQEPGSMQDNNYTEFRAQIDTRVFDMPVGIEGFYTTQDANRQAKASYIRFHYEVATAKEELLQKINTYKSKFGETVAKGQGLQMMYGSYLNKLENEKGSLLDDLSRNYGLSEQSLKNNEGNLDQVLSDLPKNIDTSKLRSTALRQLDEHTDSSKALNKLQTARQKIEKDKAEIQKRYDRIVALEKQYEKYRTLLDQYRTQLHLDSAITYSKIQALEKGDESSYKDLLKASAGLLPDGKVKTFAAGLTHFDAGIINQYESDYTMAGQNLKGMSTGYDFGFVKAAVTLGKTQYVSRDGSVDNYNSYLGKLTFKPFKKQHIELLYYGYSPAIKTLGKDTFYQHSDIAGQSYTEPVTIVSINYQGELTKFLNAQVEGATSMKKGETVQFDMDHSATKTNFDLMIPYTTTQLQGEWEHAGRAFENSTLPYSKAGTDRYTVATTTDLFHSFLTVGLQFNYMEQNNFGNTAYSNKWGFDIATHSKRFPSLQLSYKPFSTFRAYSDTLNVPQRPMTGEVWTGRASYQFKKNKISHRFSVVYNQNSSNMDTIRYASKMVQATYILTLKQDSYTASSGWSQMPVTDTATGKSFDLSTWFMSIGGGRAITSQLSVNLAEEIAIAGFGLQRMSTTAGLQYRFVKWPIMLRLQARYTNYRLTVQSPRTNLYAGQIGMGWQFKLKKR
ncbi:hypothetical protein DN068_00945 [Taibaiella soli]|uniref:Uncharacterized protein n=2 Tax=Taibaiella soli TaxID=1649169 RepID=A0A2W2AH32_9BACT|nr:hypothetical protein DN068_00945 [Taibaiella soli]